MFTDDPVTPTRLEALIGLLREYPGLTAQQVRSLLQPKGLGEEQGHKAAEATLNAAKDLGLARSDAEGRIIPVGEEGATEHSLVLAALDAHVLGSTDVEPYFALFYAFAHGCTEPDRHRWTNDAWFSEFNERVFQGERQPNPFNPTKLSGLYRWFDYAGLGWFDSAGAFQPCPYGRLQRALPVIFRDRQRLHADEFMRRLALACPELDGGVLFLRAHPETPPRTLQRPLAQALVELHLDRVLRLHAVPDSQGWDMSEVEPPLDKATLRGDRLDEVEVVQAP